MWFNIKYIININNQLIIYSKKTTTKNSCFASISDCEQLWKKCVEYYNQKVKVDLKEIFQIETTTRG